MSASTASFTESSSATTIDEAELKRINAEMIEGELITPDHIYLDLALFKDFIIGTLLHVLAERRVTMTPEAYTAFYHEALLAALPAWRERYFDDVAHSFPKFNLTTDAVRTRMADPAFARDIFYLSPVTQFVALIQAHIAINVNHSAVKGKRNPINLVINTYPLQLSAEDRHVVGIYFANLLRVNVTVILLDPTRVQLNDLVGYDEIYTAYFKQLFDHSPSLLEGFSALRFINKRLFVRRIFGDQYQPHCDITREMMVVKTRMDIMTQFTFVPAFRFAPPPLETEVPHG